MQTHYWNSGLTIYYNFDSSPISALMLGLRAIYNPNFESCISKVDL